MVVPAPLPAAACWPRGRLDVRLHLPGRGQEADHRARRCSRPWPHRPRHARIYRAGHPPAPPCARARAAGEGLGELFAPRGIGKTYMALAMAYAIASGGKFLRWSAPISRSVLYVDGEMPANEMQERMRRLAAAHGDVYPDALKVLSLDTQAAEVSLNLASELDQGLVEQIDAEVLILDNRSTLVHGGRENDAEMLGQHATMVAEAPAGRPHRLDHRSCRPRRHCSARHQQARGHAGHDHLTSSARATTSRTRAPGSKSTLRRPAASMATMPSPLRRSSKPLTAPTIGSSRAWKMSERRRLPISLQRGGPSEK